MTAPVTLAAIDAGSNALRVRIASASSPTDLNTLEVERVPVRLGHGTFNRGALDARAIEDAVLAFSRFRKLFDQHGVERYRAVATSAVRNASNREDLLDRLFREVGIELEVIDGQEEARLVRKAVLSAFSAAEPPRLIVDLGGGSLEITGQSENDWVTSSTRIGTVRLLETFGLGGAISDDEARMIRRFVASQIRASFPIAAAGAERVGSACGGNAEALAALFGKPDKQGIATLKLDDLEAILPQLLRADVDERMDAYGVRRDRAEVIGVAAIVFATVGEVLGLKKYRVPGVGIREGVLLDLAEASVGELSRPREHPTVAAARTFAARIGHGMIHGEQVRRLAMVLFEQLREVHGLPDDTSEVLQLAALLHDVGEVVHRRAHHKHSEYLILHGRISGLDSPKRELVAAIARGHRKSPPNALKHACFAGLSPAAQDVVTKLTALVCLADALDSDHRQRILAVSCDVRPKKVVLNVSLERSEAVVPPRELRKVTLFEQAFARRLAVQYTEVSPLARTHATRTE